MASSPETGSSRQPSSFRYRRIAPFAAVLAVAAAGAVACVGSVGESWNEHGGSGGGPGGGGGAGGTGGGAGGAGGGGDGTGVSSAPLLDCSHPTSGPAPLRRLTQSEYNATVRDLLGDTTHPADGFPPDQQIGDFTNTAVALTVPPLLAQAYQAAAEQLATHAVAQLTTLLPCNPSKVGEDACAQQFIHVFGPKAFRRPLRSDEEASLFTLYQSNRDGADFTNGVQAILEAVLQSASFLYRPEFGVGTADPKGLLLLGPYETASRLSYLVWGSMPDDALFAAAAAGALATGGQVADQARRLLTDPKAKPAAREFFLEWLSVNQLASSAKDSTTYPEYTPQLEAAMQGETSSFVDYVLWQSDGKLATLLTSPVSFVNADLAKLYGLAGVTGSAVRQVTLDPTQRAGILTEPALMTRLGKADRSSPVLRGKFVRERLLCQTIDPPPFDVVITPPPVTPGVSTREMFAAHEQVQPCKGCHTLMDPIGFGFESFDGIGRYRTTDQGQKVDASGKLTLSDVNGDFNGAVALAQKLARSEDVSECLSTEWFRYGVGRGETGDDACAIASVKKAAAGGADMKEVLVAIAQSDSFRYRPEVK